MIASDPILNSSILADTVRYNLLRKTDKYVILNEQKESEIPNNFRLRPNNSKILYDVYDHFIEKII